MAQILGSTLVGGSFSPPRRQREGKDAKDNIGDFVLAIDPRAFRAAGPFESDLDDNIDALHATRSAGAEQPVRIPGEPERQARAERSSSGIPIPHDLMAQLHGIATRANLPFSLDGR